VHAAISRFFMQGAKEEVDEALSVAERIAKKARPKEDAAEMIRRFRDARGRWQLRD